MWRVAQLDLRTLGGNHGSHDTNIRNYQLPHVRCDIGRGDPDGFLPFLLRMSHLQNYAPAEAGGLLRLLFIWGQALSFARWTEEFQVITFRTWRIVHRSATSVLAILAMLHSGLGLLFLAVSNWSHVGLEPCTQPTAPVVRWANLVFVLLGIAAVIAVPEPQAYLVLAALIVQAIAGTRTLSPSA